MTAAGVLPGQPSTAYRGRRGFTVTMARQHVQARRPSTHCVDGALRVPPGGKLPPSLQLAATIRSPPRFTRSLPILGCTERLHGFSSVLLWVGSRDAASVCVAHAACGTLAGHSIGSTLLIAAEGRPGRCRGSGAAFVVLLQQCATHADGLSQQALAPALSFPACACRPTWGRTCSMGRQLS